MKTFLISERIYRIGGDGEVSEPRLLVRAESAADVMSYLPGLGLLPPEQAWLVTPWDEPPMCALWELKHILVRPPT